MRRLFIPEVIQTSAMDCGPAALKALLEGVGVQASYGRLREACFTGVDGTSIDQIEEAAVNLGLDAEQVMLPGDHVLRADGGALPALVVVRLAGGATHFVIAWRLCGGWVQIMDPGVGRQWRRLAEFQPELYLHTQSVPLDAWREWAGSADCLKPLKGRICQLGIGSAAAQQLLDEALASPAPLALAAVDAAVRLVESLASDGAVDRGRGLVCLIQSLVARPESIPPAWWSARRDPACEDNVLFRGAVLLRVKGLRPAADSEQLSSEFADALTEKARTPASELWRACRAEGLGFPLALGASLALAAAGVVAEALLLRGIFELPRVLALAAQRWSAWAALLVFASASTLLEHSVLRATLQAARQFEGRMRVDLFAKIPRLPDAYFRSRLLSDMAERAHSAHMLRELPALVAAIARSIFGLIATVAGISWLYPESWWPACCCAAAAVAIPLLAQPWLSERDLRARSHSGALSRFFFDALMGITAVRAHGAGRAIVRQHEILLGEWAAAAIRSARSSLMVQGTQAVLCLAAVSWLLFASLAHANGGPGGLLLLVYWALSLPALGQEVATLACQYPRLRNTLTRFTEILGARDEETEATHAQRNATRGVAVELDGVAVRTGGHALLEDLNLRLNPGEHVAVVGSSGAGKSSLAGLLLGWQRPAAGAMRVDGEPFTGAALAALRAGTVWLAPQVQLWNRSLFDNLEYGNLPDAGVDPGEVLDDAELSGVIEKLPAGMQTALGESGRLLSGGEGQRVRFGRGLRRGGVRLAILDEAFRGLERGRRRALIETARRRWNDATLLHITHDIDESWEFPRVLVVEGGRVIEDGSPEQLFRLEGSRYRALVNAEASVSRQAWSSSKWRKLSIDGGSLREAESRPQEVAC